MPSSWPPSWRRGIWPIRVPDGLCSEITADADETEAEVISGVPLPQNPAVQDAHAWEREVCSRLLRMGAQHVVITLGSRGAYLASTQSSRLFPAYRVSAVDVTAAGDAFNGAMAVALAEGRSIEESIAFANAAGALATTRAGSQPSLATRQRLKLHATGRAY